MRYFLALILGVALALGGAPAVKAVSTKHDTYTWSCFKSITPATWAGATSYAANGVSPTLILQYNSFKVTPIRLDISQDSPVAGGLIYCVIKVDTAARYSSGGNLWLARAITDAGVSIQPSFSVYDNPTVTNENIGPANPITIFSGTIFQTVTGLGTGFVYDFPSYVYLPGPTGTLLIYLYASTTAPTWRGTLTVME